MRLSHRRLEECRQDPRAWVREKLADEDQTVFMGYDGVLRLGIHNYHTTGDRHEAQQHTYDLITESYDNLTSEARREDTLARLDRYIDWIERENVLVADDWVNIDLPLRAGVVLGGRISRVDVIETGIRGILLYSPPVNWRGEVGMPLIQRGLARLSGRDEQTISVGYQAPDAGLIDTCCFSASEIQTALGEANRIADRIATIWEEEEGG